MSNLKDFMLETTEETQEIKLARFKAPFKIKTITEEENDAIRKASMIPIKKNGVVRKELDSVRYSRELMITCVVEPNFKSTELCDFYKTLDPLEVPGKMLRAGEYMALSRAISKLNGFDDESTEEIEEEAKNS